MLPITDDKQSVAFYPYFSAVGGGENSQNANGCVLGFGNTLPGTISNFGKNAQYGSLLFSSYLRFGGHGSSRVITNNYRQILPNPCQAVGD